MVNCMNLFSSLHCFVLSRGRKGLFVLLYIFIFYESHIINYLFIRIIFTTPAYIIVVIANIVLIVSLCRPPARGYDTRENFWSACLKRIMKPVYQVSAESGYIWLSRFSFYL